MDYQLLATGAMNLQTKQKIHCQLHDAGSGWKMLARVFTMKTVSALQIVSYSRHTVCVQSKHEPKLAVSSL